MLQGEHLLQQSTDLQHTCLHSQSQHDSHDLGRFIKIGKFVNPQNIFDSKQSSNVQHHIKSSKWNDFLTFPTWLTLSRKDAFSKFLLTQFKIQYVSVNHFKIFAVGDNNKRHILILLKVSWFNLGIPVNLFITALELS